MNLFRCFCLIILLLPVPVPGFAAAGTPAVVLEGDKGAVATVNAMATQAAEDAFAKGGNAIDAALAAAFTLGVVDSHNSGIGGGCFILVRWADGRVQAIDGREMAPSKAHRDMYLRNGEIDTQLSKAGALAPGVPGSVGALYHLQQSGGKLSWADVILPAADIAEDGFAVGPSLANRLSRTAESLQKFPASAAIFLDPQGQPWPAGRKLVQKDLATTYRKLAEQGPGYFYGGEFAKAVERWMQANGGVLTAEDFARYQVKIRQPVQSRYRGYQIYGFPPPSSGGVHVAQMLNILENFDLPELQAGDRYHLIAEAMKLAFADRAYWLGDTDYVDVPIGGLISTRYARQLAQQINMNKTLIEVEHGQPPTAAALFDKHTTHLTTADAEGNWVAITTTVNTSFGSKVTVPGTGVLLNNQMDDFSSQPGVPNAFGLVGAEANRIEPGKRPLSSMSPTIVMNDQGEPVMTVGAAGGPTIITQVLQALVYTLTFDKPLEEAIASARIHHQWKPGILFLEKTIGSEVRQVLEDKGHQTRDMGFLGASQGISFRNGHFEAVTEPRIKH